MLKWEGLIARQIGKIVDVAIVCIYVCVCAHFFLEGFNKSKVKENPLKAEQYVLISFKL